MSWRNIRACVCALLGAGAASILCCGAAGAAIWHPPAALTWYWQLQGSLRSEPVQAYDIDGFDTSKATVTRRHAQGKRVICYIDAGTWEKWRPDAGSFPRRVLGRPNGWPGERWLDIRQLQVLEPIMITRFKMCRRKGFDALEPDNIDGWENNTGFAITGAQQVAYNEWIARTAHQLGLAVFQKNDPEQTSTLQPFFDGALDEQCRQYDECSDLQPYVAAGKPVLDAEYQSSLYPGFCSADNVDGIMGALFNTALNGSVFQPCWSTASG
ncbi:MAG TPA: endo alpha-1,4 polygalactosaminidase [Solirubrobacteraceae bacterium]|jgi:hypothetical protein